MEKKINYSEVYVYVIIMCFSMSLIGINIRGMNVTLGDLLLIVATLVLIGKNNISIEHNYKKVFVVSHIIIFFLIFFSLVSLINFFSSPTNFRYSFLEIIKLIIALSYGFHAIYFFYFLKNEYVFFRIQFIITAVVGVLGILGTVLYQFDIATIFQMNSGRAKGTMSDTNIMAIYMVTILPIEFIYMPNIKKNYHKIILVTATIGAILASASKAAILVLILSIFLFIVMNFFAGRVKMGLKMLLLSILILLIVLILNHKIHVFDTLTTRLIELKSGNVSKVTTGRSDLWKFAVGLVDDWKRLIFGIGYGRFGNIIREQNVPNYLENITLVHNTNLSMLVETGIANFFIMLISFIYILLASVKNYVKKPSVRNILLVISIVSLLIGVNEVNLQNNRFPYFFIIFYLYFIKKSSELLEKNY
jgi:O-antigen ligase